MNAQEQAVAERAEQVRQAEERTRKALEDLQRHGQTGGVREFGGQR
ncbi:hypothetical protein [Streptomyces sp. NPDC001389]